MNCSRCLGYISRRIDVPYLITIGGKNKKDFVLCDICAEEFQYGFYHFHQIAKDRRSAKYEKISDETIMSIIKSGEMSDKELVTILRWLAQNSEKHESQCYANTKFFNHRFNRYFKCTKCFTELNWIEKETP